jgi:uncharacterized protein
VSDSAAASSDGSAQAFRQFVVKMHSRCDIACDYCYVYEHADQSWRSRPVVVPDATIDRTAWRIGEHARAHRLDSVRVVLHGGEPLLAGPARISRISRRLRTELPPYTRLDLRLQTNGVRLADDEALCRLLVDERIKVGISLDGDRTANDRHRLFRNGASSYDKVVRAARRIGAPRHRESFAGFLCTIDLGNDPVAVYRALVDLDPPRIDFLLPHATWDEPPPRQVGLDLVPAPYADWLIRVFEQWTLDECLTPIRVFDSIRSALAGRGSLTEALGTEPSDLAVVETDGAIEQADSLKTAYDGAPATGFDVFRHSFDDASAHAGFAARRVDRAGLCAKCRRCEVVDVCGGGLYAHRYRRANGFDNPSVHCADLLKLIKHVDASTRAIAETRSEPPPHTFSPEHFDAIAAGFGDEHAMAALRAVSESRNRALVVAVLEQARRTGAHSRATWAAVDEVESAAPDAFGNVLTHPYVRVWAERCLDDLRGVHADFRALDHLRALILAAAAKGGVDLELSVAIRGATLCLPTLGSYSLSASSLAELTVRAHSGALTARPSPTDGAGVGETGDAHGEAPTWRPRRLLDGGGLTAALEDTDPYRDCHHWPIEAAVSDEHALAWQRLFRQAWQTIERDHSGYAPALRAGLQTIVPLQRPATGLVSSTARQAFGSVAIALPDSADELALLLIHEFQHVKLSALMDLFELFDPKDTRQFDAPWREDKRPLDALMQGTYAHAAVTDVWRARWHRGARENSEALTAGARFVYWREQVARAVEELLGTGSLDGLGTRLVEAVAERVHDWLGEPVPRVVRARARTIHDPGPGDR